jgi:hypothetical protein
VRDVEVTGEFIDLGQLLQLAGIVDTGGGEEPDRHAHGRQRRARRASRAQAAPW